MDVAPLCLDRGRGSWTWPYFLGIVDVDRGRGHTLFGSWTWSVVVAPLYLDRGRGSWSWLHGVQTDHQEEYPIFTIMAIVIYVYITYIYRHIHMYIYIYIETEL